MMRKWIIPLAILMVVPALGAATPIVVGPPTPETLVEGHTVFTVIEQVTSPPPGGPADVEFAAAVAVLVREATYKDDGGANTRFPGVLWFNDQYLVDPRGDGNAAPPVEYTYRTPCTGAVIAVNAGTADPRVAPGGSIDPLVWTYVESYQITDPNDRTWTVDKWATALGALLWNTPIMNNELGRNTPDDDTNCRAVSESELPSGIPCVTGGSGNQGGVPYAPGFTGLSPGRCEDAAYTTSNGNAITYNAVLYFELSDLTVAAGVKDHSVASTDVSGCHATDPVFASGGGGQWPCPGLDDNAEGNSHAYNPFGDGVCPICAGQGNHGGSDLAATPNVHAMNSIDLYYGAAPTVAVRTFAVLDVVGSAAPYHAHDGATVLLDSAPSTP